MAHITTACKWCYKAMNFFTENKKDDWWKCDKCNKKAELVRLNDCFPQIETALKNGKWVIGKRANFSTTHSNKDPISEDFVVFVMLTSKGDVRATHSQESTKRAYDDLFGKHWDREQINEFGFNSLEEIDPLTVNK